jgi:hypothetical protein
MRTLAGLIGTVLAAAVVVAVAWCAWALTARDAICAPDATALACTTSATALAVAIAVALTVVLPVASLLFRARTSPRGSGLRALTYGLAGSAAGGAVLFSALHDPLSIGAQTTAFVVGAILLSVAPIVLLVGMTATLQDARAAARAPLPATSAGGIPGAVAIVPPSPRGAAEPAPPTMSTLAGGLAQLLEQRSREEAAGR